MRGLFQWLADRKAARAAEAAREFGRLVAIEREKIILEHLGARPHDTDDMRRYKAEMRDRMRAR